MSLAGAAWHVAGRLAAAVLPWHLRRRAVRGKEITARLPERQGHGAARPEGRLFWLHAASVGESLSVLPVLEAMAARDPGLHLLVTTGTVTSAELLQRRLPPALAPRVIHRFVPLDVPGWVARFLDGWRPDAAAMVESELWPNLLAASRARRLPMALVNGRISPRSLAAWRRAPGLAREMLGGFRLVLARSSGDAAALRTLGAPGVESWGDLKEAAPPLPADDAALAALRAAIGDRRVVLAASIHPGEEALVLAAHQRLGMPDLLTILVPRHAERGPAFAATADFAGLPANRRSAGALPAPGMPVHVADTMGELGLFYRLAGAAIIGGTLAPRGGQNPLEGARLRCPMVIGPHHWNFAEIVARLVSAGGAVPVPADAAALAEALRRVLTDAAHAARLTEAAAGIAAGQADLPDRVAQALLGLLPAATP
jgi:3-deoxy-D-manno-octulosonic-acid transferase